MSDDTIPGLDIRSSWLIVRGDVCTVDGRRWNGKRKGPRKKPGPRITVAGRARQEQKISAARERRRAGLAVGRRDP